MKKIITILFASGFFATMAQNLSTNDTLIQVTQENLSTPTNAAFTIMGTTPSEIVKPSTVSEFSISVQNATDDFSSFPNNYGFAVNPFWWINGKQLKFKDEFDTLNNVRLWRHLQLSAGVVGNIDESTTWRYGAGIKTNILSGKIHKSALSDYLDAMDFVNSELAQAYSQRIAEDTKLQTLYVQKKYIGLQKGSDG